MQGLKPYITLNCENSVAACTLCDMIQAMKKQSDLNYDVCITDQFYDNNHNSQFDHWIGLNFMLLLLIWVNCKCAPYKST
jgi:hypothetical protein